MLVNPKYKQTKQLSTYVNQIAETKLISCVPENERQPVPIQTGAQATFVSFNTGVTSLFPDSLAVDGISVPLGTAFNQRNGNYIYYKKTHFVIRTEMNATANAPPIQFRMIVAKLRRQNSPEGVTALWDTTGFLDSAGLPFGHGTSGKTGLDLMMQPINKRQWVTYCDKKFVLQPYNDFVGSGTNIIYSHYPASKEIQMNLPYFKKVYMTSSNLPEDMAYRYIIVTYAHTLGRSGIPADSYEQSFRGTTSFADI
jgi:hypothetical protein